jgi:hypothetical protein
MAICYLDGETYEHRSEIKGIVNSQGLRVFAWDQVTKTWMAKDVPDHAIDRLAEIVQRKCPGLTLRVSTSGEAETPF